MSNFMTPNLVRMEKTSKYKIELSSGKWISNIMYGVTVWDINTLENLHDLSKPFDELEDAEKYIDILKNYKKMYYIIKEPESKKHYIKHIENSNDGDFRRLQNDGFDVVGQFDREDYAKYDVDWKNGDITNEERQKFMSKQ